MTSPALAFPIRKLGRHYTWPPVDPSDWPRNRWGSVDPENIPDDVTPQPSITNILGILDAPALRGWYAEHAIRGIYDSGSIPLDCDEAVARFKWAANKVRDERADAGTDAHDLMERHARGEMPEVPDEMAGFWQAGLAFWDEYRPEPVHVETTVVNPEVGYAGTGDLFANVGGGLTVIDYKTRAGEPDDKKARKYGGVIYESNRLQLAALAHAQFCVVGDGGGWSSVPMPTVRVGMGVVLYESGEFRVERMDEGELGLAFGAFCGLVAAWGWKQGLAA